MSSNLSGTAPDSRTNRAPATVVPPPVEPKWMAVMSLALGVFGLLTAEYLPASLLTPIAEDLGVSEALVGQAVTVTAGAAVVSGLLTASLTRRIDRRVVLLGFTVLMIVSNSLVALAPNMFVLLAMRILLGVALGGFWSMAAATAMRLVPAPLIPRAVSIIFSGIAVATIVAVPLGSYLGDLAGWRSVFWAATALGVVTLVLQLFALPRMTPQNAARLKTLWSVLIHPSFAIGIVGMLLVHVGHYALFTYIRPALETMVDVDTSTLAALLFAFGVANLVGTLAAGWLLQLSLRLTLALMPLLIGIAALGLALLPANQGMSATLVVVWGLAFGGVSVAWSNWATLTVPDKAESAGGIVVVGVQSGIAAGAGVGGATFGLGGVVAVFWIFGVVLIASALFITLSVKNPGRHG
ncbi:MFS transporter [Rhodococcus sovatensis]|uniref:MFS transporter n=1 Tax=Rhodococcus sovatensis TaxID=1805840 RepID=A0ABZ2PLS2_9NOCA